MKVSFAVAMLLNATMAQNTISNNPYTYGTTAWTNWNNQNVGNTYDPYYNPTPSYNYVNPTPSYNYVNPTPSYNYVAPTPSYNYVAPTPSYNYVAPTPSYNYVEPAPSAYDPLNKKYSWEQDGYTAPTASFAEAV